MVAAAAAAAVLLPQLLLLAACSRTMAAACTGNLDCALNGVCSSAGQCECDAQWEGEQCERFAFVPGPSAADLNSPWAKPDLKTSTWGMGTLQRPVDGVQHMFGTELTVRCVPARTCDMRLTRALVVALPGKLWDRSLADKQRDRALGQLDPVHWPLASQGHLLARASDLRVDSSGAQRLRDPGALRWVAQLPQAAHPRQLPARRSHQPPVLSKWLHALRVLQAWLHQSRPTKQCGSTIPRRVATGWW
jgi:hypothetical protein